MCRPLCVANVVDHDRRWLMNALRFRTKRWWAVGPSNAAACEMLREMEEGMGRVQT